LNGALTVTEEFERFATSFSGCNGGNPDGGYWFCGIEWGGSWDEETYGDFNECKTPGSWSDDDRKDAVKYQYDRKIIKLIAATRGDNMDDYSELVHRYDFLGKESQTFKLNLFPIAFHGDRDELWQEWLFKRTGLETKTLYRAWCQAHRFPIFRSWVKEYTPRVIVCTSRNYETEFIMAFGGGGKQLFQNKKLLAEKDHRIDLGDRRVLSWITVDNDQTLIVVTPFLGGRWGLNSNDLLKKTGEVIARLEKDKLA